jgi:hypothetical protein
VDNANDSNPFDGRPPVSIVDKTTNCHQSPKTEIAGTPISEYVTAAAVAAERERPKSDARGVAGSTAMH